MLSLDRPCHPGYPGGMTTHTTEIGDRIRTIREAMGWTWDEMADASATTVRTLHRWCNEGMEPSPRALSKWLAHVTPAIRDERPELAGMLEPVRVAVGVPGGAPVPEAVPTLDAVPASADPVQRYAVRIPDGSLAVCESRPVIPGHLHAVRSGDLSGVYRVSPNGRSLWNLTRDERPGDVVSAKRSSLDRCDPVVSIVRHLLGPRP